MVTFIGNIGIIVRLVILVTCDITQLHHTDAFQETHRKVFQCFSVSVLQCWIFTFDARMRRLVTRQELYIELISSTNVKLALGM